MSSKKAKFLEGADWVEFNDMLNNICDKLGISANISSSVCIVRKGNLRRTIYGSYRLRPHGNYQWNYNEKDEAWLDNLYGGAMISDFPEGTPGIYEAIDYNEIG